MPPASGGNSLAALAAESRRSGSRLVREIEFARGPQPRYAEISIIPLHAEEHIIFVRDITARRRAEEESHRLAAAVEQAADAVVVTDTHGTIQYVNPAFEHILGYRREDVVGRTPALLKSGRHDGDFYEKLWNAIQSGRIWKGRFTDRRKDDTLVELNAAISPIRDPEGKIVHYVAVSHDVTREIELEDQLRQAQKMEAIGRLAGGIAHDFNNLLTSMMGNADLILRRLNAGSPVREDVEQIREAAQQAAALIAQLLTFSRKQVVHPRAVHLNDTVNSMARLLKRIIGNRIELITDVDPAPGVVRADPVQLEQVIMNLALNARDAMPNGGQLTLRMRSIRLDQPGSKGLSELPTGLYMLLQVVDTGTGMDAKTKARIFEPFFTTKEVGRGTGLGLATVYGIVQQCGGAIMVDSAPGEGSTFSVYLPQACAAVATAPGIASVPSEHPRTILVADDEVPVRRLLFRLFVDSGYQVVEAGDGQEALEILRRHGPDIDLLLTDIVMPRLDGHGLIDAVRTAYPRLPVVVMSGHPETTNTKPDSLNNYQFYVRKPFRTESLLDVIQRALAQKK